MTKEDTYLLEDNPQSLSTAEKNTALGEYLLADGVTLKITKTERYEGSPKTGWLITYET